MQNNTEAQKKTAGIQIQSVARSIEILNCFREQQELGISELSQMLGLNKSTVYGLVNTLTCNGFLEQVENGRKYRLGIALFELGYLFISRLDSRKVIKDSCAPLAEKYHATLHIATYDEGEVVYLDKIDGGGAFISSSNVGRRLPLYCTGVGKVLLAYLPPEYRQKYIYGKPMKALTANTITDRETLEKELEKVRENGIAFDNGEVEDGLSCVAAPIFQINGTSKIAVSLSFPFGRIRNVDLDEVIRELRTRTLEASARQGYHS